MQIGDNISKCVVEIFAFEDGELNIERFGPGEWEDTAWWITVGKEDRYEIRESSWLELLVLTGITKKQGLAMLREGKGVVYDHVDLEA